MSMADVNRMIKNQLNMTLIDLELRELESLEYYLSHNPSVYGNDLEIAQKRYLELKAYYDFLIN